MNPKRMLLGLAVLALLAPTALAYTPLTNKDGNVIEPDPVIRGNVTIAHHKPACGTDVLCYYDDSNTQANLASHGFAVQTTRVLEPIQFTPAKVDVQYYSEDPQARSTVSAWGANISNVAWLDASQWTGADADDANDVFSFVTRNGAHAIHVRNPGGTAGVNDVETYTLDFTDITTDVEKMRLIIGIERVSQSTENVEIRLYDANNTAYNRFTLTSSASVKADGSTEYLMNGTHTGTVFWDELISEGTKVLGGLSGEIAKLVLTVGADSAGGANEFYIYALGVEAKRHSFGIDDVGNTVYNMTYTGCDSLQRSTPLGHVCLSSFNPSFSYQNIKDLKVAYALKASTLPESRVTVIAGEDKTNDQYPWKTNYRFQFHLPQIIDVSFAGDERIQYVLPVAAAQHKVAKSVGLDKLATLAGKTAGQEVDLGTPRIGTDSDVEFTILYTDAQMLTLSEGTAFGIFREGSWGYKVWAWLAGIAGVGVLFAKSMSRKRRSR